MDLTAIFYNVDNFCKQFDKWLIIRSNMKPQIIPINDKMFLRKRASILKDKMPLQYTKVRSAYGFACNIILHARP